MSNLSPLAALNIPAQPSNGVPAPSVTPPPVAQSPQEPVPAALPADSVVLSNAEYDQMRAEIESKAALLNRNTTAYQAPANVLPPQPGMPGQAPLPQVPPQMSAVPPLQVPVPKFEGPKMSKEELSAMLETPREFERYLAERDQATYTAAADHLMQTVLPHIQMQTDAKISESNEINRFLAVNNDLAQFPHALEQAVTQAKAMNPYATTMQLLEVAKQQMNYAVNTNAAITQTQVNDVRQPAVRQPFAPPAPVARQESILPPVTAQPNPADPTDQAGVMDNLLQYTQKDAPNSEALAAIGLKPHKD